MKNTGDDAFMEVASWGNKKYWNNSKSRFLAPHHLLPKTITPTLGFPLSIPKTYEFQRGILIKSTNYLISAGGSTIHSELAKNNIKKIAVDLKKKSNLKIGAIGVSLGPFKTTRDENAVKEYLKELDFLAVRDQRSFDFASSIELPYQPVNAFDLAALLPEIYYFEHNTPKSSELKIVGISVCPVESVHHGGNLANENKRNAKIVDFIKIADQKENILFRFFIINGNSKNGDLALTQKIIEASAPKNYEIITYQKETEVMWKSIATCDFVLATRLHAAIFACFAKIPFMLIEYHQKCSDFLTTVGYNSEYRIGDAGFDPSETAEKIIGLLANSKNYVYPTSTDELIEKAELNFTGVKI